MKLFLLAITTLLLLLQGCKPDSDYEVTGNVSDGNTGDPVALAKVYIDFSKLDNGAYSNSFSNTGETETDDQGNYTVEFLAEKVIEYRVRVVKDGFFRVFDTLNRNQWLASETNDHSVLVYRDSKINFHFFSKQSGVTVLFKLKPHSKDCATCCSESNYVFGGIVDTTFTCSVYGNQTIEYELTRVSGVNSSQKTGTIDVFEDVVNFEYEIY
jgi:hypothetical protein